MEKQEQLRTLARDGRVYIDFDQLLGIMYNCVQEAAKVTGELRDPAASIMVAGMTSLCESMEKVLTVLNERIDSIPQV